MVLIRMSRTRNTLAKVILKRLDRCLKNDIALKAVIEE